MKSTIIGALVAALILFLTTVLALLTQEGVNSLADIGQIPWIVAGIGAVLSFLKDYQALDSRKFITSITGG